MERMLKLCCGECRGEFLVAEDDVDGRAVTCPTCDAEVPIDEED